MKLTPTQKIYKIAQFSLKQQQTTTTSSTMVKFGFSLCVLLCACLLASRGALGSPAERAACIARAADYLGQAQIDAPVMTLVAKSREFYPDVLQLIEDEVPSNEYTDALLDLGSQVGCTELDDHFHLLTQEVPCYESLDLEKDDDSTLDMVRENARAKEVFEAYYACVASEP